MNSKETLFAGLAGLRGSVSLILAQAVITEDKGGDSTSQVGNTIPETEKGGKRMQMFMHTCTDRYYMMSWPALVQS